MKHLFLFLTFAFASSTFAAETMGDKYGNDTQIPDESQAFIRELFQTAVEKPELMTPGCTLSQARSNGIILSDKKQKFTIYIPISDAVADFQGMEDQNQRRGNFAILRYLPQAVAGQPDHMTSHKILVNYVPLTGRILNVVYRRINLQTHDVEAQYSCL